MRRPLTPQSCRRSIGPTRSRIGPSPDTPADQPQPSRADRRATLHPVFTMVLGTFTRNRALRPKSTAAPAGPKARPARFAPAVGSVLLLALAASAAQGQGADPLSPDPEMERPISALDSVFIEELTWIEVRDAMRSGKDTAIVATGGVEMNGPYLATGKHQFILRANVEAIARQLGNALVAPLVPFVPEGDIRPPTSHMRYPGTVSVREETFQMLLTDIAESLRAHGFRHVVFLSDSNGNVAGMTAVAERLAREWSGDPTSIHYITEYYGSVGAQEVLDTESIREVPEGHHDGVVAATQVMVTDPAMARTDQRIAVGKMSINGIDIAPPRGIEIGNKIVDHRARLTVAAIRRATGAE